MITFEKSSWTNDRRSIHDDFILDFSEIVEKVVGKDIPRTFSDCSIISVNVWRISTGECGECRGSSIFGAKNVNSGLFEKSVSTTDMHQAEV